MPNTAAGRRGLMVVLLVVLVAIEAATVTAVVLSQRVRTEEALALHTQQLLKGVADSTRDNALKFLTQAQHVVELTERFFSSGLLSLDRPQQLELYFLSQLALVPQIDGLYFADTQGQFLFTKRSSGERTSGYQTKIIDRPGGARRVRKIWRDVNHAETERAFLHTDTYDPRVRPWYGKARASATPIWSDPYVFFTSQAPGVTAAARVDGEQGELVGIAGVDVALGAISDFLAAQSVTANGGAAVLLHQKGDVLAYPKRRKLQVAEGDGSRLARVDELDSTTTVVASRLKTNYPDLAGLAGSHYDSVEIEGKLIVSMFMPFSAKEQWPWVMGVYAPEENFSATIRAGQQQALLLGIATSMVIVLAAFTLSPMLIRPLTALQERVAQDPLSQLLNRPSFEELAVQPFKRAHDGSQVLSAIMLELDHFGDVKNTFGQQVTDEVIAAVAGRIQQTLPEHDLVTRFSGEKFAILLLGADLDGATIVANRLHGTLHSSPIETSQGAIEVTVSIGAAQFDAEYSSVADLLGVAEFRMDEATRRGGDRVVVDMSSPADKSPVG